MTRPRRRARILAYLVVALLFLCGGFVGLRISPGGALGTAAVLALLAGEAAAVAMVVREAGRLKRDDAARAAGRATDRDGPAG